MQVQLQKIPFLHRKQALSPVLEVFRCRTKRTSHSSFNYILPPISGSSSIGGCNPSPPLAAGARVSKSVPLISLNLTGPGALGVEKLMLGLRYVRSSLLRKKSAVSLVLDMLPIGLAWLDEGELISLTEIYVEATLLGSLKSVPRSSSDGIGCGLLIRSAPCLGRLVEGNGAVGGFISLKGSGVPDMDGFVSASKETNS